MGSNIIQIGSSAVRPSWSQGFARSKSEAANPSLWDGLVGAWFPSFGATGATLHDISPGAKNNGTLTNSPTWVKDYLDFDGVDQRVTFGNNSSLKIQYPLTIAALVKLPVLTETKTILSTDYWGWLVSNYHGANLGVTAARALFIEYGDGLGARSGNRRSALTADAAIPVNQWTFVAGIIRSPTSMSLYVDGSTDILSSSSGSSTSAIGFSTQPVYIGLRSDAYLEGGVKYVIMWDRALAPSETALLAADEFALPRRKTKTYAIYTAPAGGLSIPVAMHHRKLIGVA